MGKAARLKQQRIAERQAGRQTETDVRNHRRVQRRQVAAEDEDTLESVIANLRRESRMKGEHLTLLSWVARTPEGEIERYSQLGLDDGRDLDEQDRREAQEDAAFDLLESTGDLDTCIARGLIAEDEQHKLTITPAGWELARSMGLQSL